ncbi:MAG: transglutaminase domain-containing protein [Actinomycetes bacterium]
MRLDVRYRSVFAYTEEITESHNELRACPATDAYQRLIDYRVTVDPSSRIFSYTDAWGTRVEAFGVRGVHERMVVTADATVETSPRPLPTATTTLADLQDATFRDGHIEYLQRDRHTDGGERLRAIAREQVERGGPDVVGAALAIHRFVGGSIRYTPGATLVGIAVDDVLTGGVGVCQDYAHLAVTMCRAADLPARYVSGYLFTDHDASGEIPDGEAVVVQTHAWIEVAIPGWGWLGLDPTNGQLAGERHIKIGHGRSYDDVQPLRGVFLGPARSTVAPMVEIRRLGADSTRRTGSGGAPGQVPQDLVQMPPRVRRATGARLLQQQQQQ